LVLCAERVAQESEGRRRRGSLLEIFHAEIIVLERLQLGNHQAVVGALLPGVFLMMDAMALGGAGEQRDVPWAGKRLQVQEELGLRPSRRRGRRRV
jgi:hypothetical protein